MLRIYFYRINETELDAKRERALSVLPLWRVEKYSRMIPRSGKLLSLAAGLLLRHGLLDTLGTELKELEIAFNRHEKPCLTGKMLEGKGQFDPVYFNLSHAGEYVALAVSDIQVGIDIETKQDPGHGVAEHVFNEEEREAMKASEDPERYFTRLWTRKEAYVKCTGTGITVPLNEFSVLEDTVRAADLKAEGDRKAEGDKKAEGENKEEGIYQIRTLRETPEYALSVCVRSKTFPKFSLDIVGQFSI